MKFFILKGFVIWRILLFLASYIGSLFINFQPRFPYADVFLISSGLPFWFWSFANFDGVHYLTIANSGYSAEFTQVFFPLYPIILSIFSSIIFFVNHLASVIFISNLFFLAGIVVFYFLLKLDYKISQIKWILLFLLFFPTSYYFGSLYTEGLFFFLVTLSFYFARKKRWIESGIIAGLASGTRLVGIFLLPALLYEWYQNNPKKKNIFASPILYLAPLGLIIYMVYLQINFGDFLYFWHAQPVFGAEREGTSIILLPQVFWRYIKIFLTVPVNKISFWIPLAEFLSTIGTIALLILAGRKKIRRSYLIFSWASLITPTLTGTLSSMPRYILTIFPVLILLGLIKSNAVKFLLLFVFMFLLLTLTLLFTRGIWVA